MSIESRLQKLEGEIRRIRQHGHTSRHDGGLLEGAVINGVIGGPGDTGGGLPGSGGSGGGPHTHDASGIGYDNTSSGLTADDVQEAIDEIVADADERVEFVPLAATSVDLDYDVARYWDVTTVDDGAFAISNPPPDQTWGRLVVVARTGPGGPHTWTWPASVDWADPDNPGFGGGPAPVFPGEGGQLVVELVTVDGGLTYGGSWQAASTPLDFGEVGDIQPVGTVAAAGSTGKVADAGHVHTIADAVLAAAASALIPVDTGTVTYDHSGDDVLVTIETVWGIDTDSPYYDDAGAAAGEEAALYWDPAASTYVVVPYQL